MNIKQWTMAAVAALVIAGCGGSGEPQTVSTGSTASTPAAAVAHEQGSLKKGDPAICVVCNVKEGTTAEEEVKETVDYQGKTYGFCDEAEKAEFISNPAKYAVK